MHRNKAVKIFDRQKKFQQEIMMNTIEINLTKSMHFTSKHLNPLKPKLQSLLNNRKDFKVQVVTYNIMETVIADRGAPISVCGTAQLKIRNTEEDTIFKEENQVIQKTRFFPQQFIVK